MAIIVQVIRSFLQDLRGRWKQFLKKRLVSQWKTNLANFFSFYRISKTSGNFLLGSTKFSGNHFASYKIISVTPNRLLKTQIFEKKAIFPMKKNLAHFFDIIEYDRPVSGHKSEKLK